MTFMFISKCIFCNKRLFLDSPLVWCSLFSLIQVTVVLSTLRYLAFVSPATPLFPCSPGGVQCPNVSALLEVRSCNDHPCTVYHWQTGPWGQCIEDSSFPYTNMSVGVTRPDDGSCAVGMQTRKVICVRVNVGQVPPKK